MNSKYKIVIIISMLLVFLSISITSVNYWVSLNSTQKQLKDQSLPLSLDNIYTVIQKHIIEPYLVSSMMANDTFVQNWIVKEEDEVEKIKEYLNVIKNKYGMFTTFLVSKKSGSYYTQDGYIETVSETNDNNKWYFDFLKNQNQHEINLDFNEYLLQNSLIMFINYKIFDSKYNFLGVTGVGLKISYINDILKTFRQKYYFKVFFIDEKGDVVLSERGEIQEKNIKDMKILNKHKDKLISKNPTKIEYKKDGEVYLLNTKYIPELNLYLLVEAKLEDFTKDAKRIFYINLFVSFCVSFFIIVITILLIKNYNKKLEHLAGNDQLTGISNRRVVEEKLLYQLQLQNRTKKDLSLAFLDIDDFKTINDSFGHAVGDKTLIRIATILKENIRKTDLLGRWGGEEFVIVFVDSNQESSYEVTEKLRKLLEEDYLLKELSSKKITTSAGLTSVKPNDTVDSLISRADTAMYEAKHTGKNKVIVS